MKRECVASADSLLAIGRRGNPEDLESAVISRKNLRLHGRQAVILRPFGAVLGTWHEFETDFTALQ